MKFLIIDDERSLYKAMFSDLINSSDKNISEVPIFNQMPRCLSVAKAMVFNDRINRHLWLPFKKIYDKYYSLTTYNFNKNEKYWVVMLNGTLNTHYSAEYISRLKKEKTNVKFALIMYDHFGNRAARRVKKLLPVFDHVFSFDQGDCDRYGLDHILSTFSIPHDLKKDDDFKNTAEFVGRVDDREQILEEVLTKIGDQVPNCRFHLVGVDKSKQKSKPYLHYYPVSYHDELMLAYNSNCIIEILKAGQNGISLRTCEAIVFNKKLVTNNQSVKQLPYYNPNYIKVISNADDVDVNFIKKVENVEYNYDGLFSPYRIIEKLKTIE